MKRHLTHLCLFLLVTAILVSSLASCFGAKEKTFTVADELSITLTDAFVEKEIVGQTAVFQSPDVMVSVLLEEASLIEQNLSVKRYAELVCSANGLTDSPISVKSERAEFTYEKTVGGKDYMYFAKCFKTERGYWLVQFACFRDKVDKHKTDIEAWADTISFQ